VTTLSPSAAAVHSPSLRPLPATDVLPTADLCRSVLATADRLVFPTRPDLAPVAGAYWTLDPSITFLNHGSYGSVPRAALRAQAHYRERIERDPVRFFKVDLEALMDGCRERLGAFLNCRGADLAPVCNATFALCTILANTPLQPGDEVLITDHEYGSLTNELERIAARSGARVVKAEIPFPIASQAEVAERFLAKVTPHTRIGFISHITSASSLVFPVAEVVREFNRRGVDIVVDGAHSPGQVPVDVHALAPTYFVGSGHKWLSGPKGTGFIYVRPDRQARFRPVALSSRAAKIRPDRALFLRDFDYQGTDDYSAMLTLPHSIEAMGAILPGGWPALLRRNHDLAMAGRRVLCDVLGIEPPAPETMIGTMATLPIPEPGPGLADRPTLYDDALQDELKDRHGIVAPVWRLPSDNTRVVRISAQLYNSVAQYERLAHALREELAREHRVRASA